MRYMMFVIGSADATEADQQAAFQGIDAWFADVDGRGVRACGAPLEDPDLAACVRVRGGETIVSDGPFVEGREFVAGFDLIDCADIDDAIDVAAGHPVARFGAVEIRPFAAVGDSFEGPLPSDAELEAAGPGRQRHLMLMCLDGVPAPAPEEEQIVRDAIAWGERLQSAGIMLAGQALAHQDMATTVRVRNGATTVTDGPFIQAREFVGGFAIVDVSGRDEAIALAAEHPLARYHVVETRALASLG